MNLKEIHFQLLKKYDFNPAEIEKLWHNFEKVYTSKSRYYHNLSHLEEMIAFFEIYKDKLLFPDEVLFAIFYHDYIYDATRKDNELKSAEYAISILPKDFNLNKELIFDMICATQHHLHNKMKDVNWLIDFDLKILSKDWDEYKIYCNQIRKEYKIYPDFLYNPGRKKALLHFLENKNIYQTQEFRDKYESKARENILKEIEHLS